MKKELYILVLIFFFLSLTVISGVYATDDKSKLEMILEKKVDVTGDGEKEVVQIKGEPLQGDSYYKNFFLEIVESSGKTYHMKMEGGKEPNISFKDLNHDQVKDIFVTISADGGGDLSSFYLFTVKGAKVTDLSVPESLLIQGQFLDRYIAKIKIDQNNQSHKFNLKERAEDYENTGLYFEGKLNEPMELMIHSFDKLEPIEISEGKIGLRGNQIISGAYEADMIGRVESTWVYENESWVLRDTKVFETHYEKGKE